MQIQWVLAAVATLALLTSAQAQKPDAGEESSTALFNTALSYLTNADTEREDGSTEDAAILYKEAAEKYTALALRFPDWQQQVVQYRIAYCNEQLRELKKQNPSVAATNAPPPSAAPELATDVRRGSQQRTIKTDAAGLLRAGDPGRARTVLLSALRTDPDDVDVRLMLAIAQCQATAYRDAAGILTQLIEEEPTNALAHMVLGAAYLGQGRVKDAGGETSIALTLDANNPAAHYNMARIFLQVSPSDRENAKRHYRKFMDLGGMPDPTLQAALESPAPPVPISSTNAPSRVIPPRQ